MTEKDFLRHAIELSKKSVELGGFPVGAIIVKNGEIISEGISNGRQKKDATSHAEIDAIRQASEKMNTIDLLGCEIYSSMEPCLMCFSACYWSKIKKVVYAISKDKLPKDFYEGVHLIEKINLNNNRQMEIAHVVELEDEALDLIRKWEESLIK